jgi:hypothetical protein
MDDSPHSIDVTSAADFLAEAPLSDTEKGVLAEARESLVAAGFYSYGMLNEQQQWCIAVDDEAGRVDIWLDGPSFVLDFRGVSPGLYFEEVSDWRRRALARLARRVVPNIARGMLEPNQSAVWSDEDQGVAVKVTYSLPITQASEIGRFVRAKLPEIEDVVTVVENQLRS